MVHLNTKLFQPRKLLLVLIIFLSIFNSTLSIETTPPTQLHDNPQTSNQDQIKIDEQKIQTQEINEMTFSQFLKMNDHAVIYFYTQDCNFCREFDSTFTQMEKIYHSSEVGKQRKITFGKLKLTQNSQKIFKDLNVQAVPELRFFTKEKVSKYVYFFNEYNKRSIPRHLSWIERVSRIEEFDQKMAQAHRLSIFGNSHDIKSSFYIPEIKSLEQVANKLKEDRKWRVFVFNCSYQDKQSENRELSIFLKNVYLEQLRQDFYCTNNISLLQGPNETTKKSTNEIFITSYKLDSNRQNAQLDQKISLSSNQLSRSSNFSQNLNLMYYSNFKSYMNRQLEYWSNKAAIQVFTRNSSGFVFVMNNETKSKGLFEEYKNLKQKLNKNDKIPSIKFYHTDLSTTPQQTTRIKKYLFGVEISVKPTYPYPALGFIRPNSKYVQKYLFPLDKQLTAESMEYWILKVISKVENVQLIGLDTKLQETHKDIIVDQYFRTTDEELFPLRYRNSFNQVYFNDSYTQEQKDQKLKVPEKFFNHRRQFKYINFLDFQILLSTIFKQPIFVFVNSRNDFKSYELYVEVSDWLQEQEEEQEEGESEQEQIQEQHQEAQQHDEEHVELQKQQENVEKKFNPYGSDKKDETNSKQDQNNILESNIPERLLAQIQNNKQKQLPTKQNPNHLPQHEGPKVDEELIAEQTLHKANPKNKHQADQQEIFSKLNLFLLNFNNNDYPPSYKDSDRNEHELKIQYFPAILYFSADKKVMKKIEGVQTLEEIQSFIAGELLNQSSTNSITDGTLIKAQGVKQDKGESDRQLEGEFEYLGQSES